MLLSLNICVMKIAELKICVMLSESAEDDRTISVSVDGVETLLNFVDADIKDFRVFHDNILYEDFILSYFMKTLY